MYTTYYTNGNGGSCDNLTINKYQDQQISNRIFLGKDPQKKIKLLCVVETELRRKKKLYLCRSSLPHRLG